MNESWGLTSTATSCGLLGMGEVGRDGHLYPSYQSVNEIDHQNDKTVGWPNEVSSMFRYPCLLLFCLFVVCGLGSVEKECSITSILLSLMFQQIQRIFWPRTISNCDLLARCQQEHTETSITRRQLCWIWYVLRKDAKSITKVEIHWTPEGKQKCGRLKTMQRRIVEVEMKNMNRSWGTIQRLVSDNRGGGGLLLPYTPPGVMVVMKMMMNVSTVARSKVTNSQV